MTFKLQKKTKDTEIEILSSLGAVGNGHISTGQNSTRGLKQSVVLKAMVKHCTAGRIYFYVSTRLTPGFLKYQS